MEKGAKSYVGNVANIKHAFNNTKMKTTNHHLSGMERVISFAIGKASQMGTTEEIHLKVAAITHQKD
jgi:hypothetical protein